MAVYRDMDVGTAKPTASERGAVPHHLIDLADPSQEFTVSRFGEEAREVLDVIEDREHTALLVGGTGLYVQAVVDGLTFPGQFTEVRADLESRPDTEAETIRLWARLRELDPEAAAKMEPTNRRRIMRALEVCIGSGKPFSSFGPGIDAYPPTKFVMVGLEIERAVLDERIDARYDQQMEAGFLDEVRGLRARGNGWSRSASQGLGYRELAAHLDGDLSLADALDEAKRRTRRFARRQQRWFRRDPRIKWFPFNKPDLVSEIETWWEESEK